MGKYKAKSPGETLCHSGKLLHPGSTGRVKILHGWTVTRELEVASVLPQVQQQVVPSSSAIPTPLSLPVLLLAGGENAVHVQVQVSHFSPEHFWVALLASAALAPSGPVCCHLTCGGPAQQELLA